MRRHEEKRGDTTPRLPTRLGSARERTPKRAASRAAPAPKAPRGRRPRAVETPRPARAAKPKPTAGSSAVTPATPAAMLERAMAASTPRARALWARRGLASRGRIDRTTQSMLLRQLYLAYYEEERFDKALDVSTQSVALGVLPDVAHQDAARAAQALGDVDVAAGHLRLAARTGPPARRAFHWWTLGSLLFLAGRHEEAESALTRAARWGTTDKPLYQGHLAVVRCASGKAVPDLAELIQKLEQVPAGQGYGRFVLGQMAFYDRRWADARRYLEAFVGRSTGGRTALALALDGEIALARKTLADLPPGE